ncbi:MAG: 50S ribosomal protein L34e [Candidatus Micrarchaeota archaeon]
MAKLMKKKLKGRYRKTPTGNRTIIRQPKKPSAAICGLCGRKLFGVPKKTGSQLSKLPKTKKRPERKFGGVLCSNCVSALVKEKTRLQTGIIGEDDVSLAHLKYIKKMRLK